MDSHSELFRIVKLNVYLVILTWQVEQEFIYYVHDNTETLEDHFTVTANDTDLRKHSAPWTVYVQIIAVNDQPPVITANRVLRVRLLFLQF